MNNRDVYTLFGGTVCPHCNEEVYIEMDNWDVPFLGFNSVNSNASKECVEFNRFLNQKLEDAEQGRISHEEVRQQMEPYRSRPA